MDALALMDITVDFDELSIRILNDLNTATIVATSATIGMVTSHHLLEHLVFLSLSDHGRRLLPPKVGPVALCGATGH